MLLEIILSLTVILPAVLVLSNHKTDTREWLFFLLSSFLSIWVFSNFLVDFDNDRALLWARTTFFAIVWACYFFYEFTLHFPERLKVSRRRRIFLIVSTVVVSVVSFTPIFITGVEIQNDVVVVVPGLVYGAFLVYYPIIVTLAFINLWKGYSSSRGIDRARAFSTMFAFVAMTIVTSTTNLILPVLFDYNDLAPYGGYATIIFTFGIGYSMLRHKLFDIRSVAARTFAYVSSIGSIVLIYTLFASFITDYFLNRELNQSAEKAIFIVFLTLTVILAKPVKEFFDKVTNRIFFRDVYEPQALIDSLNKTLVASSDLVALLTKVSLIIQENLRTSYCTFYVLPTSYSGARIIGAHRSEPELFSIEDITELLPKINTKICSIQGKTKDEISQKIKSLLIKNDFDVMARLVGDAKSEDPGIGMFFIGPKKSGVAFDKQDFRVLEIIANELVIAVENILRYEEIEQFNATLQLKIEEATKELKKSNKKLLDLDEAKDEFVSMASHQLRTPLTSIKGYLSMVLDGDVGQITDQQKQMLGQAFFSSQRMVYLISDLLNVSRLKTGKFAIERRPIYLPDLVESEINQLLDGAKAKNLTLSFEKPKKFTTLMLDDMKIRQVVMNFVDNALYYTPNAGKITVELTENNSSVSFTVTDTGIGVPKEQQHKLFAKFYRADNARKSRPDGTGLGLFMAKKVIVAQGGSLIFKSTEGKGSTFGFSFSKDKIKIEETE